MPSTRGACGEATLRCNVASSPSSGPWRIGLSPSARAHSSEAHGASASATGAVACRSSAASGVDAVRFCRRKGRLALRALCSTQWERLGAGGSLYCSNASAGITAVSTARTERIARARHPVSSCFCHTLTFLYGDAAPPALWARAATGKYEDYTTQLYQQV